MPTLETLGSSQHFEASQFSDHHPEDAKKDETEQLDSSGSYKDSETPASKRLWAAPLGRPVPATSATVKLRNASSADARRCTAQTTRPSVTARFIWFWASNIGFSYGENGVLTCLYHQQMLKPDFWKHQTCQMPWKMMIQKKEHMRFTHVVYSH